MREQEPERHRRRSVRLAGYDYASPGAYFVTVCTYGRRCVFDAPEFRDVVEATWRGMIVHFPDAKADEFVVMPNHVHGILWILEANGVGVQHARQAESQSVVGARHASPLLGYAVRPSRAAAGSLGAIIGSFKSAVTKRLNEIQGTPGAPVWQRNYYERVIRDEDELDRVREYILLNPLKWDFDRENPRQILDDAYESEWSWLEGAKQS